MPEVACPHCQRTLHLPRDVARAKLKCKHCQNVFVASTRPQSPPSPSAQTPAVKAPPSRSRKTAARRKPNVAAVVASIVGAMAVIAFAAVGAYFYMYPHLRLQFDNGQVWFEGRVPRSERDEKIAEFRALKEQRGQDTVNLRLELANGDVWFQGQVTPAEKERKVAEFREYQKRLAARNNPDRSAENGDPDRPRPNPRGPELDRDPKIRIQGVRVEMTPGANGGHVVALLSNDYDQPLRSVVVTFHLFNAAGAHRALEPQTISYVPAQTRVHISAPFNGLAREQIARVAFATSQTKLDRDLVIEMVRLDYDWQARKLTGWVGHNSQDPMMRPGLHVVFLDDQGAVLYRKTLKSPNQAPTRLEQGKQFFVDQEVDVFLAPDKIEARLFGRRGSF